MTQLCIWDYIFTGSQACPLSNCPTYWTDDALERDLYIQTTTVTVLAMDGRRRWLDIQKLVSINLLAYVLRKFLKIFAVIFLSVFRMSDAGNASIDLKRLLKFEI